MEKKLILIRINKILLNTCNKCEMKTKLNKAHGSNFSKIDGFCNKYCLIGKRLQELGKQYRQFIRPRKVVPMYIDMTKHKVYESKYSKITKEFLQSQKDSGKTIAQISEATNIPKGTLGGLMLKHGLSGNKRGYRPKQ